MAKSKICNCGCGAEFIPTKIGQKQLSQSHYITWLINTPEGQKKQAEAKEKAKKIIEKKEAKNKSAIDWQQKANDNWPKFKREQKKETRSYQQELILTKNVFQSWIRLRDKYRDECISCRKKLAANERVNASHYFKAELFSGVIFHPFNLWKSCITCNMFNDGNLAEYTPNLIAEIGQNEFDTLTELAMRTKQFSYERAWLVSFRKYVNQLIKKQDYNNAKIFLMLKEIVLS
jgi:hypothetical protein